MKAGRSYWLCQVLGWGAYSVVGVFFTIRDRGWANGAFLGWVAFFLYSVALTHLFRHVIHQRQWALAITWRTAVQMLSGALTVAAIQTALVFSIDLLLEGKNSDLWQTAALLGVWGGTTWACIIWTILYLSLTTSRRGREKDVTLELLRREAELRTLESQVNPHFLFNCLNSIRALVAEDPAKAQDMITRFAAILRYSLHRDLSRLVPLADEVEVAADYLALESIRFEDRLRVRFDIAPDAAKTPVPPMLLQTLVENALKHGIARLPSGGEVTVRASLDAGRLVLEVGNTGSLAPPTGAGLGLKIARDRLRLLFADRAKLVLAERASGAVPMVVASVIIPRPQ
jgi:two-component system, LytTR family, sensor histidine kinase AlgZ